MTATVPFSFFSPSLSTLCDHFLSSLKTATENASVNALISLSSVRPGEPVYAQVNRDKKKNSRNHSENPQMMMHYSDYSEHADHWQQQQQLQQQPPPQHIHGPAATPAGDSWV